jgi:flagellar hook-associated protein FlgK
MSAPSINVLVGFEQTTGFATPFQLDIDPYGKLDTGTLGGVQMIDVTSMVRSIGITRGRNRDTEQFNAGTASVAFYDPNRDLDPLNDDSPYYPWVGPRMPIEVYANGFPIYSGTITDWDLDYDFTTPGNRTTAQCADNFTVLANMTFAEWAPVEQKSGARITASLERPEISYQGSRAVATGQSTLGGTPSGGSAYDVEQGTNVLSYLQRVAASEGGFLFMDRANTLTFVDRSQNINPSAVAAFTEDGSGIAYSSLLNQFGDELLFNSIQMQSPAGNVQTATDPESIARYQASQYSKLDLLNSTTSEVLDLAGAFLATHKDPILRFTGVNLQLAAYDVEQQNDVLALDLVDVVTVQKSYDVGSPASLTESLIVSGIQHSITPGSHTVSLTFEHTDSRAYFTLDDALFGRLDFNYLYF